MFPTLFAAVLAAMSVGVPQATVPVDARAAIAKANGEWVAAMKARNAATIAAPYAEDGIFVTATGTSVSGRQAVERLMRERFEKIGTVTGGELVQDGLTVQGAFVYEWGHARLEVAREGAAPEESRGRYLTVWQKNGKTGRWEIIRNLSLPE